MVQSIGWRLRDAFAMRRSRVRSSPRPPFDCSEMLRFQRPSRWRPLPFVTVFSRGVPSSQTNSRETPLEARIRADRIPLRRDGEIDQRGIPRVDRAIQVRERRVEVAGFGTKYGQVQGGGAGL